MWSFSGTSQLRPHAGITSTGQYYQIHPDGIITRCYDRHGYVLTTRPHIHRRKEIKYEQLTFKKQMIIIWNAIHFVSIYRGCARSVIVIDTEKVWIYLPTQVGLIANLTVFYNFGPMYLFYLWRIFLPLLQALPLDFILPVEDYIPCPYFVFIFNYPRLLGHFSPLCVKLRQSSLSFLFHSLALFAVFFFIISNIPYIFFFIFLEGSRTL